jgi:pyruvate-ferredoxin/flavodoxin oxidoreductase
MPASTGLFRDMTAIRFRHPEWIAENCTACGRCYTVCPDTAIPGLVSEVGAVFDTVIRRLRKQGRDLAELPRASRTLERELRAAVAADAGKVDVARHLEGAIERTLAAGAEGAREKLAEELGWLREELGGFRFAVTRPYFGVPEEKQKGSGGLLSITVDPWTCKGCMECVEVCDDDALRPVDQTPDSIARLRREWNLWLDLPTTPKRYQRIDDLEQGIGALETLLLDKAAYLAFSSGACLGCSEKTIVHLFTATVEALMQPRVARFVEKLDDLVARLKRHVQLRLVEEVDLSDPEAIDRILEESADRDLTLSGLAGGIEGREGARPIDPDWLRRTTRLLARLSDLRWRYSEGTTGRGRSKMGMVNSTGCTSVWGSTWPYNPYPFPWANHLFQDSPSMAMGIFEGHMAKMADAFRAVRMAEKELDGGYEPARDGEESTYFDWHQFTDEEWELCPPVVAVGGDGAMYDIGFQNLSRLMASAKPVKVLVVDTQVYSNTGGQACTSGFVGQISDMAQYGKVWKGKPEPRKEIGLIGMAHRTTFVLQGTIAHPKQMIEGFIRGLKARRPALFNLYSSCQPEHGIGDDLSERQARLAVESRAYPLFTYDPDRGRKPEECFDLDGNPAIELDWPVYKLRYHEAGQEKEMEVPMTFADFAVTEGRFRKHFRLAPPDTWSDAMVPLHEFLELAEDDRADRFPFVWSVDRKNRLTRLLVDRTMVESCEERRDFWTMLRAIAGIRPAEPTRAEIEAEVRRSVIGNIANGLLRLVGGGGVAALPLPVAVPAAAVTAAGPTPAPAAAAPAAARAGEYVAPWIDSAQCTSCNECVRLNPKMFVYGADGKAYIKDATAGPYTDLVKAAERCTARVIHPGAPADRSFKDAARWIARGAAYN